MELPKINADPRKELPLSLFFDSQPVSISSSTFKPKAGAFAAGAEWREYEGEFCCHPTVAVPLKLGTFLWGAHTLGKEALHLFRVIITGQFPGPTADSLTRCTFVAVGPFRVIPSHLPLSDVVRFEQAVRSGRSDPAVLESYRAWCLDHGWVDRAAELGSPHTAARQ